MHDKWLDISVSVMFFPLCYLKITSATWYRGGHRVTAWTRGGAWKQWIAWYYAFLLITCASKTLFVHIVFWSYYLHQDSVFIHILSHFHILFHLLFSAERGIILTRIRARAYIYVHVFSRIFRKCIFRKCIFSKILQIFGGLVLGCIKRNFARKYSFDSIFQALQDLHPFAPLQSQNFGKKSVWKNAIFVEFQQRNCKCRKICKILSKLISKISVR